VIRSRVLVALVSLAIGIVIGGILFSRSQPRSFIALGRCENCLSLADLLGLLGSVGIQRFPGLIPSKAAETDKTVAIRIPAGSDRHFVIIPKKDLKDLGDISSRDLGYLTDAFLVARHLIEKHGMRRYRFYTNGPDRQAVTYLHFHLVEPRGSDVRDTLETPGVAEARDGRSSGESR
jgi:diadenosine tetraphosphate (Ap4A) HIT family hydrolase